MKGGTRRMWARRVLRAGWLLAPILSLPSSILKGLYKFGLYCFTDVDHRTGLNYWSVSSTVMTLLIGSMISVCVFAVYSNVTRSELATNEQIAAAVAGNQCMVQLMPAYMKSFNRPLNVGDLRDGETACNNAYAAAANLYKQKAAIAEAQRVISAAK